MNLLLRWLVPGSMFLVSGCDSGDREASATAAPPPVVVARVDTIVGRLESSSRSFVQNVERENGPAVLLALRSSDVGTCEDLGRQARELQRWAVDRNLRLVVWVEADSTGVVETFLRRERIRPDSIIRSAPLPRIHEHPGLTTPASLLVESDGTVRGIAHRDRVPNVRTRSFADELEALLAADLPGRT